MNKIRSIQPSTNLTPRDLIAAQKDIVDAVSEIQNADIVNGKLITGVSITGGATTLVAHGLGRRFKGWTFTDRIAATGPYRDDASTADKTKFLPVTASSDMIIDIWVF